MTATCLFYPALTLLIGAVGGALFHAAGLPLPWMLGALFATMALSVAGVPLSLSPRLRQGVVAVIGVLLGSRFTPEVAAGAAGWALTVGILGVYMAAVAAVVVPFYRLVGRFDWPTAYFAGMPGGLSEMVEIGEAKGADVPSIVLAHSLRIVLTIALVALWFRVVLGHDVGAAPAAAHGLTLQDAGVMLACGIAGAGLGKMLHLPAPTFLGPMALSAAVHLTGISDGAPPALLVSAAQVVLGSVLGCRFRGIAPARLVRAGALSLGATVLTLLLALLAGVGMHAVAGVPTDQAILALAPGGLTEMGLVALAIGADAAFVALHHVVRILAVIVLAPVIFALRGR